MFSRSEKEELCGGCCAEGRLSFGEGSFAYSAGALRNLVKQMFRISRWGPQDPNGSILHLFQLIVFILDYVDKIYFLFY